MKKSILMILALLPFSILTGQENRIMNDFEGMMEYNAGQINALAQAIPEDVYRWAPSDGVRNTGEVINHISAAWYFMAGMLGVDPPEGINPQEMEKSVTDKDEIIEGFNTAYNHVMAAASELKPEEYGDMVYFPPTDSEVSKGFVLLLILDHVAEHKGQLIAYARSNEIVPPWSQ